MWRTSREARLRLTSPWPTPATMATLTSSSSSSLATLSLWSRGPGNLRAPSPPRATTLHTHRYGGQIQIHLLIKFLRVWQMKIESQYIKK